MMASSVERTLAAARAWLHGRTGPEAVIDRLRAPSVDAEPREAARQLRRVLDEQARDGSWDGDLLATARALMTLRDLTEAGGLQERDPAIGRAIAWIRSRRGVEGAWTDGCSPDRHAAGFCHHFIGGFFSPGPPDRSFVDAWLRCGVRASNDQEGRFLASAAALRAVLAWQPEPSTDGRLHLRGLRGVVRRWTDEPLPGLSAASLLAAVHALTRSTDPEDRRGVEDGIRLMAGRQRGDGSWVGADPFQALDVFLDAEAAGICHDRCHTALWHGVRLLVSAQNSDGSWGGDEAASRRALIACQALRRIEPAAGS